MTETERLRIHPASQEEMERFIAAQGNEILKAAYTEMPENALRHPDRRECYAMWMIERKDGTHVGELCFMGIDDAGATEIGYGIAAEYEGRGYAAEAVRSVVRWAPAQPGITRVEAETDDGNIASQKVLANAGFVPTGTRGEEGPRFVCAGKEPL